MRIGIDLGGTKIEGILIGEDGSEINRLRTNTPQGDYPATVQAITQMVEGLSTQASAAPTVGVGIPGAVSIATGLIKNANSVCLIGQPLEADLEAAIGRPVKLANDANCFAVSEAVDGAGKGERVVFGVILGTGVGGGIAIDRHAIGGINGIAGEWGHNPLPWPEDDERPGPPCYCGRHGCIETFLSGPAMARDHFERTGETVTAHELAQSAIGGDLEAKETLRHYEERLARALATVINILDPDVIVLGGGLSNIEALYASVPKLWDEWVFSDRVDTRLVPNVHGDSSGVRGAAWLWD